MEVRDEAAELIVRVKSAKDQIRRVIVGMDEAIELALSDGGS